MTQRQVIFLVNLLQDVNIIRPLVYMVARDMGGSAHLLVTSAFRKRDKEGVWQGELQEIQAETGAGISYYEHEFEALRLLAGKSGVLVAASESNLAAHKPVHDVFRLAPPSFLRVTLQHGFECVGFLQSRDQNLAHGKSITFAADVICGWCEPERLTSVVPSQRPKLHVTGPTAVLQTRPRDPAAKPLDMGIVCENMHSPRLNAAGDFKTDFLTIFSEYCQALDKDGQRITLRPHPGGQYTLKNKVQLAENVKVNNAPIYRVDLSRYAYGISAPSSILIDMVLAGIPTAVWQDDRSVMDLGNYEGLTRISGLQDWLDFSREAVAHPERFIEKQQRFLENQKMLTDQKTVYEKYAGLLGSPVNLWQPQPVKASGVKRVLIVANGFIPTLQISFTKPLAGLVDAGKVEIDLITETQINRLFKSNSGEQPVRDWLRSRIDTFDPGIVIFCRYSGPHSSWMLNHLDDKGIPSIYHIDDDLLHIPQDIGLEKYNFHNKPERLSSVRYLLDNVTLVYGSTRRLKSRLEEIGIKSPIVAGEINCSGEVIKPASLKPVRKIGYMGIGHEKDLEHVLPALVRLMRENENLVFEFFGSIPVPESFKEFGGRVTSAPKIENYGEFLRRFSEFDWDIGICPLLPIPFNFYKSDNKWVEYTSVGAAVVASKGIIYDECCGDGCGMLAETEEEWFEALNSLVRNPEARFDLVFRAQKKLADFYSTERLREQVLGVFLQAHELHEPTVLSVQGAS